jgi:hypothetical protein
MTNKFPPDPLAQHRRCAGPLGDYIAGFEALLGARGYARATMKEKLRVVAGFSRWLDRRRLKVGDVDERRGVEFLGARRRRDRAHRGDEPTLRAFVTHLRQLGVIPAPPAAVDPTELFRVEQACSVYLVQERGLSRATVINYLRETRRFLVWRFAGGAIRLDEIRLPDVTSFVSHHARAFSPGRVKSDDEFEFRSTSFLKDEYTGPDDPRLQALVKEAWMRTLYGSAPRQIVEDQFYQPDELGQGWSRENLVRFLAGIPGWDTVSRFLALCQSIGAAAPLGIELTDPFDGESFRWHPAARDTKPLSTRGTKWGFTFYIDVPRYDLQQGMFRVDGRKMRDCVAPRLVHMLDAMFNGLVVEQIAAVSDPQSVTLAAVHDAWIVAVRNDGAWRNLAENVGPDEVTDPLTGVSSSGCEDWTVRGARMVLWAGVEAAREWFAALGPVYDDLVRLAPDRKSKTFARRINRTWARRLAGCRKADAAQARWEAISLDARASIPPPKRPAMATWPKFRLG